jgi:hypothetical protein
MSGSPVSMDGRRSAEEPKVFCQQPLEPLGLAFVELFTKAFERISEAFEKPPQSLQGAIKNPSPNSNKDKDNHSHQDTSLCTEADLSVVQAFADRVGWAQVTDAKIRRLIAQAPGLTVGDLADFNHQIAHRSDVRDPVAYLASVYAKQRQVGGGPVQHCSMVGQPDHDLVDGNEMTFDD